MSGITGIIDLTVSFLKEFSFGGISAWWVLQGCFWVYALWIVVDFFLSRLSGGGD